MMYDIFQLVVLLAKKNRERKMKRLRLPAAERSDACPRNMKPE